MLTIYTPQTTNRIRYTFDLFFTEQLRVPFVLTDSLDAFHAAQGAKFCYDSQTIKGAMNFGAAYLLFEKGITEQKLEVTEYDYLKVFYQVHGEEYVLPFDPFAATFFLVSRYEEYLPHRTDQHGRFPARESFAYKNDFLHIPVVNYYINLVKTKLQEHFPDMKFHQRRFKYIPSYDIDSAYNYKNKGFIRNIGGVLGAMSRFDTANLKDRLQVFLGGKKDPYDSYEYLHGLHQQYGLSPLFFFLVGDYGEFDKNISINISEFKSLIKAVADEAEVGIHPSYASNEEPEKLSQEIKRLRRVLKQEVRISRQHFLMLKFPETYSNLLEHDIEEDYTMGYASLPGFRAGIASSFYHYSLEKENKTTLRVYPFVVMDATLKYYMKLRPQEAIETLRPLIEEVKNVNGLFISLWHNSSFDDEVWKGWKPVYEKMLSIIHE